MTNPITIGQIGLALLAAFSMLVVHLQGQSDTRPAWYYLVALWAQSMGAVFILARSFNDPVLMQLPPPIYYFSLVMGLERVAVFLSYRLSVGRTLSAPVILRINGLVVIAGLFTLLFVGIYNKVSENGDAIKKVSIDAKKAVAIADSIRLHQLQLTNDTLQTKLSALQAASVKREQQINELKQEVVSLRELIVSLNTNLKSLIKNVGANVERARRGDINVPGTLKTPAPTYTLPPVKQPGHKTTSTGWPARDSTTYFARTPMPKP